MPKQIVNTSNAPGAVGPYSQALLSGDFLFVSGQLPIDPSTGKIVEGSITDRVHQIFANLQAIAKEAGTSLNAIVKTTVFLTDIKDFTAVNEVYNQYFSDSYPARSAFQVAALPLGADMEIEAIMYLN